MIRIRLLATAVAALLLAAGPTASAPPTPSAPSAPAADPPAVPPLAQIAVVRPFALGPHDWSAGHRGVDLAAPAGEPVLAPMAGAISFAGTVVDRVVVTIATPGGLKLSFEPVVEPLPAGTVVAQGDQIASVAEPTPHCGAAACLHWGVRLDGEYIDPMLLLGERPRIVLLPLDP